MLARIIVTGIIQGVGFRPFVYRMAIANNLAGFVRNRGDAAAEIFVQGSESDIDRFVEDIRARKPTLANYVDFLVEKSDNEQKFNGFSILASSDEHKFSGPAVPPDVSICNQCVNELKDPHNRRHRYFFNTCTECGPRFTIIEKLPFDRTNTTMKEFDLCDNCRGEYDNPADRRFHSQTIACNGCGPVLWIADNKGMDIDCKDPVSFAAKLLAEGSIIAIKGIGGFHIAASALNSKTLTRLRQSKSRKNKPFAVMAKNIESARSFALVSDSEEKLLTSPAKPIVLLQKRDDFSLSPLVSPQLYNIGVMLPYAAVHYLLLDELPEPALVMTSANPSSSPVIKDNEKAFQSLSNSADYFLVHNRAISMRCDDSVVRVNSGKPSIIRRSRGYVPAPICMKNGSSASALALGAELNNTFSIVVGNKVFMSQHIGDIDSLETYQFLKDSVKQMQNLVNAKPDVIACDLHPSMHTTRLARITAESGKHLVQVQHHYAHAASLMAEHDLDMIAIVCDGAGFGLDGAVWGGEVIVCDKSGFDRVASLAKQPMIGGDLATYFPLRMAAGILNGKVEGLDEYLYSKSDLFTNGRKEVEFILNTKRAEMTSSTGRILDAVSAILGICYERTYEGEPAMKLESAAMGGTDLGIKPRIDRNTLDTTFLLQHIYENKDRHSTRDLAYFAHSYIAGGLAEMACNQSKVTGIKTVGFSGGVAYNDLFLQIIKNKVESLGLRFIQHEKVPPGDAGISVGQAYIACNMAL